ncbi:replication protein A 70 kDa DNA-binding subunit D-like [Pyrus ussuriensis x Pyrus communis]|uniref:Replication protein A 70 kDa DNA-binding subunit D-like n=1 Tax=Pyrus ussuriensis x Pyrus communis TaxID=2448454 RepID=A0A5N5GTT9_9ROSA|nr:replication protein A 70 kDa DNA-binding subunit D-like [Pyrus ussuriensis x Pyrus communis]
MLICVKHNVQTPLPWFKVNLILKDANDETSAIIIGKSAERLFGTSCYDLVFEKGNDLLIQAIFYDKLQVQSNSKASYESLAEFEEKDTTAHNFSSAPPLFDKELKHISSTISPTVVTPLPTKSSIRKGLFSSENRKKQKREIEITEEIDEQNAADTEDFPIKYLKNKVSPSKSEVVFTASKTQYVTSICY